MNRNILVILCVISLHPVTAQELVSNAYLKQQVEVFLPGGGKVESELEILIKDKQVRIASRQGPMSSILLYSANAGKHTQLTDMNGKKAGKVLMVDFTEGDELQIDYRDERKVIAGLNCKKAIIKTVVNSTVTAERIVWFTEEIKLPFPYNFGIPGLHRVAGFPMEYENVSQGVKMIHKVTVIDLTRKIDDRLFVVPDGYEFK